MLEKNPQGVQNRAVPTQDRAALLDRAYNLILTMEARLKRAVRGRDRVIDLITIAILADGHVLLEDFPGSGKTTLAKALGDSIYNDTPEPPITMFRRIQFTPDLLPSDITGMTIFEPENSSFTFRPGPLFAHIVLADEINRTSPKVQAAMLEAMAEKQVTVDNTSHPLGQLFFVIATQNPRDQAGTYPLPVAQHDRFLFKIRMANIDRESELDVLRSIQERRTPPGKNFPAVPKSAILEARRSIDSYIYIDDRINQCLVDMANALRQSPYVSQGISTRSLVLMLPALRACALKRARDYVTAEDVSYLVPYVFAHRLELIGGADDPIKVIRECCKEPLENLCRSGLKK